MWHYESSRQNKQTDSIRAASRQLLTITDLLIHVAVDSHNVHCAHHEKNIGEERAYSSISHTTYTSVYMLLAIQSYSLPHNFLTVGMVKRVELRHLGMSRAVDIIRTVYYIHGP